MSRASDLQWPGLRVVVAGLGRSGFAAADGLLDKGAAVTVIDDQDNAELAEKAQLLEILGAQLRLGAGAGTELPPDTELVIISPGWRPDTPVVAQASARGVPIWSEIELAWRLSTMPWLAVTGTNGKTTTTRMLTAMLRAAGLRTAAVGNIERPAMEAVLDPEPYDVLAVELSSFQLHWTHTMQAHSAVVLNLHADHLDWHGDLAAYAADKARIYRGVTHSCVYHVADRATEEMVEQAEVTAGARAIGFTRGIPGRSMVGVVDDLLVDRAFIAERATSAVELAELGDVVPAAPHNIDNALAAAALARSFGVAPRAVREGLRTVVPDPHRLETIAECDGVRFVDDSKATNPHAASSALGAYDSVVWIAGGQAKGATFDDLVRANAARFRAVVLLGADRAGIAGAFARHAPGVPLIEVPATDSGAMTKAVTSAARLASEGDVVLLAPGCASRDIWPDYRARGNDFAAAVAELPRSRSAQRPLGTSE